MNVQSDSEETSGVEVHIVSQKNKQKKNVPVRTHN